MDKKPSYAEMRKSKDPEIQNRLREESENSVKAMEEEKMKSDPEYARQVASMARHKEHR